ncbi:hypothetical protein [Streptomyces sp. NPDC090994]|uniref:hypothetical protein n=1 Tax=Streptomyces sp. NPDC090994 TaxID=3365969 RepID=UPI003827DFD2
MKFRSTIAGAFAAPSVAGGAAGTAQAADENHDRSETGTEKETVLVRVVGDALSR